MTARQLTVLLIDDKADENPDTIGALKARGHADVYVVDGIASALTVLSRFKVANAVYQKRPVDIILCDVAMERDAALGSESSRFLVATKAETNESAASSQDVVAERFFAKPIFSVRGLEDRGEEFRPYGPMLALAFSRFFHSGGVVMPISSYWRNERLIGRVGEDRLFNGYVYVALALIWGEADGATFSMADFGQKFSQLYCNASKEAVPDIEKHFFEAVRIRRNQIFSKALFLPDILKVKIRAPRKMQAAAIADGEFRVIDQSGRIDTISRLSLFSDVNQRLNHPPPDIPLRNRKAYDEFVGGVCTDLEREVANWQDKVLDLDSLYRFCSEFVARRDSDEFEDLEFVQRYNWLVMTAGYGAEISRVNHPRDVHPSIRRYLLIFAQLHNHVARSGKDLSENDAICGYLGFRNPDPERSTKRRTKAEKKKKTRTDGSVIEDDSKSRKLYDLVLGGRGPAYPQRALYRDDWAFWMRPFNEVSDHNGEGWKKYQILKPPSGVAINRWMDIDRYMAARFWESLSNEGPIGDLPFDLEPHE